MQENLFHRLPHPALEIRSGTVTDLNAAARAHLPSLVQGAPVPEELILPPGQDTGRFTRNGNSFFFTRVPDEAGEVIFFRPVRDSSLSEGQLEGFSRQMRQSLGTLFNQLQSLAGQTEESAPLSQVTGLNHSFHQMLRLVNNLEFLNIPQQEAQALFRPVAMDLAGFCADLKRQAAPLLRRSGVELEFSSPCSSLLIPGDPDLLRRLVLALVSNAAKAAPGGKVTLSLQPWNDRAILSVADSGSGSDLSALLSHEGIPAPQDGAGMGLAVARRIAELHQGTLLSREGDNGGLIFTLSLPTGPLPMRMELATPAPESDSGLNPFLVELADFLPGQLFEPDVE